MRVQEAVTRPTPLHRLGPAPARMVPAAVKPTAQPVEIDTQSPRKFPWIAKRFAIWCTGTVLSATAFHLTGFVLFQVLATAFPIGYFGLICYQAQRIMGVAPMAVDMDDVFKRMRQESSSFSTERSLGHSQRERIDRSIMGV